MKGRQAAIVLGAFLGALGTQGLWAGDDDRAVPRGGGSSGGGGGHHSSGGSSGGGSSAGAHHSSGGSSSSGSSYSAPSERGSSARAPRTEAQRRHPQPGTGTGYRRHGGYYGGRYYGSYYRPYYGFWPYDDFYWGYGYYSSPWYYPRYGYYGGGYYGGYGPSYGYGGYHRGYYDRSGSVRVMVEPNETKVYVDGYYAGTSDDFDGLFQRLNLNPGRHDLALKLEGYESHNVKLYVPLDHTIKIKHRMVRGSGDRTTESTVGDPADEARYARRADDDEADMDDDRDHPEDRTAPPARRDDSWPASRERGSLRLEVSPADASIYVDGMFRGTGDDLRRLSLPEGRHRIEVVRPGYRTWERDVEVQAGETEEVDVDLPRS